jgi:hypothetical protein
MPRPSQEPVQCPLVDLNHCTGLPGMETDTTNRQELERRLAQARRIAALLIDEAIRERLRRWIKELEEELKGD